VNDTTEQIESERAALRAAWDDLIEELQNARDAIDNPALFPPVASSRVLAEGYRYLAGFMHHGIERAFHEDPDFPAFRNALSIFNKSTIDNSDAIYFYAPIDGSRHYRVQGRLGDSSHWRGLPRTSTGTLAPQYLIFETATGPIAGDTGNLAELVPGFRTGFGSLDSSRLEIGADGELEILLGPDCPAGYQGNFICTHKPPSKQKPEAGDRYAEYISGRQLFYDWEREEPVALTIVPLDGTQASPAPLSPASSAARLRRMGSIIRGQMHFWLNFYDKVLNCNGSHGDKNAGRYFFPVNDYNVPNAASSDTGGGMGTNIYAGGIFDLAEDEALYIEARYTGEPVYTSFHLGNLWGESPDFANHQSSMNHFQMHMGEDGVQRWVVAHRDPGVQNWLDTTGLPRGYLSHRWAYSSLPPEQDWPTISAKKIPFDQVREQFPADMPELTREQRSEIIRMRQLHVQRRYRVF
jgi:hypothetical protein